MPMSQLDIARPRTSFGDPNFSHEEVVHASSVVQSRSRGRNERRFPSFSEFRPLSISDAKFLPDIEYSHRRKARLKQFRLEQLANDVYHRKLCFGSRPFDSDDLNGNSLSRTNWDEEIQDASGDHRAECARRFGHRLPLLHKENNTYQILPQSEVNNIHQRGSIGGWPIFEYRESGLDAKDLGLPYSTWQESDKYSRNWPKGSHRASIAIQTPVLPNGKDLFRTNKTESYSLYADSKIVNHALNQSRQDVQDLKENEVIIIGENDISTGYEADGAIKSLGNFGFNEESIPGNGHHLSRTSDIAAFHENSPGSVMVNRQETIRRLQRGERPVIDRREIFMRTARAYQSLPEVKERRRIEKRKANAEHRRNLVKEMDARRRGKLC